MLLAQSQFALAGLLPIGLCLLWAIKIVYGRWGASRADPLRSSVIVAAWIMIFVGTFALVLGFPSPISMLLAGFVLIVLLSSVHQYRAMVLQSFYSCLSLAVQRGIPLVDAAESFAMDRVDGFGQRAMRLADLLRQGVSLPDALRKARLRGSAEAQLAIRLGWQLSLLEPALRRVAQSDRSTGRQILGTIQRLVYLSFLCLWAQAVIGFAFAFIVPEMQAMFEEFEMQPPWLFEQSLTYGRTVAFLLATAGVILTLFCLPMAFFGTLASVGWLPRNVPVLDLIWRKYDRALLLKYFAMALEAGIPVNRTVEALSQIHPVRNMRFKLFAVHDSIEKGVLWSDSLRRVGLVGPTEHALISAAATAGNLPWALQELSDSMLRRIGYRLSLWSSILFPIVMIMMGVVVFGYAALVIVPLAQMIHQLA